MKEVVIGKNKIGSKDFVYIIAEIGGNFSDLLTTKKAVFEMENTGKVLQYDIFKKYEVDETLTKEIFSYCSSMGIDIFSTPSHRTDVDLLEKFNVCAHKIGSDDAVNIPFLKYIARTNKPIILSTGMCTLTEVQRSVDAILEEGNDQLVLLHCTTNYPTHPESVNLNAMLTMQRQFPSIPVGYSDHTIGIDTCYAAAVLGAKVLEFHFTYDKNAEGPDHILSKEPSETAELIKKVRLLPTLLGDGMKRPAATEMNTRRNNRKSIVLIDDIPKGEKISERNIEIKRPGYGIPCEHFYSVLGKTASRNLSKDEVLNWEDIC